MMNSPSNQIRAARLKDLFDRMLDAARGAYSPIGGSVGQRHWKRTGGVIDFTTRESRGDGDYSAGVTFRRESSGEVLYCEWRDHYDLSDPMVWKGSGCKITMTGLRTLYRLACETARREHMAELQPIDTDVKELGAVVERFFEQRAGAH
jgi:hypothetical protein